MVILIADDDVGVRNSLNALFHKKHEVILCKDGAEALKIIEKTAIDIVMTDHQMPGATGIEVIRKGKELSPSTAFLLMTAFGSVEQAVEALRLGADDYFMKPFDLTEIEHRIRRVEDLRSWKAENTVKTQGVMGLTRLVGNSANIKAAGEFIKKVAGVIPPVLLLGPSGSGKEVMAKAIHESGTRSLRPFIAINCASLSEQLMESELFGHEKGAFTGASSAKPGKFELANGGTLFLDEVGELPLSLQAKLLRVLQEKEFFRLGGVRQIKTDARLIAATNRSLKGMVKSGSFREDLFFRLNVLSFELAPLSERREDIPILVDTFLERIIRDVGRKIRLAPKTRELLVAHSFPGNVRELQNVLERLAVLGSENTLVTPEILPTEFHEGNIQKETQPTPCSDDLSIENGLSPLVDAYEAQVILKVMEKVDHHQLKAAKLLKISRGALQYKLRKYGYQYRGKNDSDPPKEEAA